MNFCWRLTFRCFCNYFCIKKILPSSSYSQLDSFNGHPLKGEAGRPGSPGLQGIRVSQQTHILWKERSFSEDIMCLFFCQYLANCNVSFSFAVVMIVTEHSLFIFDSGHPRKTWISRQGWCKRRDCESRNLSLTKHALGLTFCWKFKPSSNARKYCWRITETLIVWCIIEFEFGLNLESKQCPGLYNMCKIL